MNPTRSIVLELGKCATVTEKQTIWDTCPFLSMVFTFDREAFSCLDPWLVGYIALSNMMISQHGFTSESSNSLWIILHKVSYGNALQKHDWKLISRHVMKKHVQELLKTGQLVPDRLLRTLHTAEWECIWINLENNEMWERQWLDENVIIRALKNQHVNCWAINMFWKVVSDCLKLGRGIRMVFRSIRLKQYLGLFENSWGFLLYWHFKDILVLFILGVNLDYSVFTWVWHLLILASFKCNEKKCWAST